MPAERSVLASCLFDPIAVSKTVGSLKEYDFYDSKHVKIFEAIAGLYKRRVGVDIVTVMKEMKLLDSFDMVGASYLTGLDKNRHEHIDDHIDIIKEKSALRRYLTVCKQAIEMCYTGRAVETARFLSSSLIHISNDVIPGKPKRIDAVVPETIKHLNGGQSSSVGLSTGIIELDEIVPGFSPADYVVIGARSGEGKTALAWYMTRLQASQGVKVGWFSYEMPAAALALRGTTELAYVNGLKVRKGNMSPEETERFVLASSYLNKIGKNIWVVDDNNLDIYALQSRAHMMVEEFGIEIPDDAAETIQTFGDAVKIGRAHV